MNYKMNIASRLIDRSGNEVSIMDLHEKINKMPMVYERLADDVVLEKLGSQIYMVNKEHQRVKLDRGLVELKTDRLLISMGSEVFDIPMEDLRYISVEQNHKITVTTPETTLQLVLEGKSALMWQLYINRLKEGEKPVKTI